PILNSRYETQSIQGTSSIVNTRLLSSCGDAGARHASPLHPPKAPPMSNKPLTPEEAQAKEETKSALKEAIAQVDSPQKAEQVVSALEARAGARKEVEVAERTPTPQDAQAAASAIQQAAATPADQKPEQVITETAKQ